MTRIFLSFLITMCWLNVVAQQNNADIDFAEKLFNSTIKIEGEKDSSINGKLTHFVSRGTGFFYTFKIGNDTIPVIITNAHVIKDCNRGHLTFNSRLNNDPQYGDKLNITFKNFQDLWILHPNEDLAIIPLAPIINKISSKYNKIPFYVTLFDENIPNKEQLKQLSAIEDVYMVGYPKGLSDSVNGLPILRKGNTATPVYLNYNGKPYFLLDIPIYSGSSGSPIFIYNLGSYPGKTGNLMIGSRFYFIGIATESQNYIAKGKTVSKDTSKSIETQTSLPFEIALILKSTVLSDFIPKLQQIKSNSYYIQKLVKNIE